MIVKEFEIVVNSDFGGFHLDTEMALWLMEHKHWRVTEDDNKFETDKYDLVGLGDYFWPTKKYNETEFRMNADLIECIRTLKKKYQGLSYYERKKSGAKVLDLALSRVQVHVEVQDECDGKETVECWTTTL
jgi:hypothetical protein